MEIELDCGETGLDRLKVAACFQCRRCTNGCPVTFAMDIYPDEVIRRVNLGQIKTVLGSNTIWVCSSCETCTTRCPNEVDIAAVMDFLKEMAVRSGIKPSEPRSYAFHASFLKEIEKRGRVFEGGLMQRYLFKSGDIYRKTADLSIIKDLWLGFKMLKKGRMPLLPERIKGRKEIRDIINGAK
jgi:heterodisulfide reductase subunit C